MTRTPWFGNLLPWQRGSSWPPSHTLTHASRTLTIIKISFGSARDRRTSPGWHFEHHPHREREHPHEALPLGPNLSSTVSRAKMLAEVWAIADPADVAPGTGNLDDVIANLGVSVSSGAGVTGVARTVGNEIHINGRGHGEPLVGVIGLTIDRPEDPASQPVRLTWLPRTADARPLGEVSTWCEARDLVLTAVEVP
jgi:hypothetical protein